MTRDQVEAWLLARRPERPPSLAAQMSRCLQVCRSSDLEAAGTMAAALGVLGLAALASVAERKPQAPELAMDLLAADAFVTYAFEAAAVENVGVAALAARLLREAG